jgi:hypothetical protein
MALSFEKDIKPLFRKDDISSMKDNGGFDLSKLADVKKHAKDIHGRLKDGDMPCDGAWPAANVAKFKTWMDEGMQP